MILYMMSSHIVSLNNVISNVILKCIVLVNGGKNTGGSINESL